MELPPSLKAIENEPLTAPPPGVLPDRENSISRAYELYVTAGICLPLIIFFASLRLYAKVAILKKWTWDDMTFLLGLGAGLTYISLTILASDGGFFGKYERDVPIQDHTPLQARLSLVLEAVYGPFIWFIKLSLFVLYVQVFGPLRWLRYLSYAGATITGLFYIALMVAFLALCTPTDGQTQVSYLTALNSSRCRSSSPVVILLGIVSLLSDLYLVILPLPAVWKLQLPLRRKIAVSAMFFTGSIAVIASAFALAYRIKLYSKSTDTTWVPVSLGIVTIIEFTAGLTICCMPSTTRVFKHLNPSLKSLPSSYQKALRFISRSSGPEIHQLDSDVNLQSRQGGSSEDTTSDLTHGAQKLWSEPEYIQSGHRNSYAVRIYSENPS